MIVCDMSEVCKSLSDLMQTAFKLSLDLSHTELSSLGHYFTPRETNMGTEKETDMVWAWSDGLMHKFYENRSTGHCSIQSMIDFDVAKFEADVEKDIATMERLLKKYGKPVRLTFAEMQRRGYKGEWAGEKKVDTAK